MQTTYQSMLILFVTDAGAAMELLVVKTNEPYFPIIPQGAPTYELAIVRPSYELIKKIYWSNFLAGTN